MNNKDIQLIEKMLVMQDTFNKKVHEDWKNQNFEWKRAIWLESAEALESLNWKWWKNKKDDMSNYLVEIIDIWHFILADMLVSKNKIYYLARDIKGHFDFYETKHKTKLDKLDLKEVTEGIAKGALTQSVFDIHVNFFDIWYNKLGMTTEDLFNHYVTKNVLNKFRQDNGYKEGTYKKIWIGKDGSEYEDNVIAYELSQTIKNKDKIFDELYLELDKFYKAM